ncbi:MAG TPA: hypothetical protein VLQ45_01605 [Thermoanaerobaculia bacterium]|nr:hypothetical protein [Thermoanaerobaculia bacterium]
MSVHVTLEELQRAAGSGLSPERLKAVICHLMSGCQECRTLAREAVFPSRSRKDGPLPPDLDAAYESVLESAADFACRVERLPPGERVAFQKAHALLGSGGKRGDLLSLSRKGVRLASFGVCEALLAWAWRVRFDDPQRMYELARFAAEQADSLSPEAYGACALADFRARAWAEFGNACRVADQLREAERAFGKAFELFASGTGDPRLKVRLHDLQASLFGTLRHHALAARSLDIVAGLYRQLGEEHLASRTLITKGLYIHYSGRTEDALALNAQALASIDKEREPGLVVLAVKNELLYLVDSERFPEANRLLFDNRRRFRGLGRIVALRVRWIEGRISYGLERWLSAEEIFREVARGCEEAELGFARALVGLELAAALLRQERPAEAEKEAAMSLKVFISLRVAWEAVGATYLLIEAFRMQLTTAELVEHAEGTIRYIRRMQMEMGW